MPCKEQNIQKVRDLVDISWNVTDEIYGIFIWFKLPKDNGILSTCIYLNYPLCQKSVWIYKL